MTEQSVENQAGPRSITKVELDRRLDAAGWGLFFAWMGIALLAEIRFSMVPFLLILAGAAVLASAFKKRSKS